MRPELVLLLSLCLFIALACAPGDTTNTTTASRSLPDVPVAKIVPHELTQHGDTRTDNYYWLREREDPEVISYLEAENAYTEAALAHTEAQQEELYDEIVARIKQDDESVPHLYRGNYYYQRYEEGGDYPIYCRKKGSLDAEEEVLINANELAAGHEFFSLRGVQYSPDQNLVAYGIDTVGRRRYTVHFRDLTTGEDLDETIPDVTQNFAWANDNKTLFYSRQDPQTLRWYQVKRHQLGSNVGDDPVVYEESDEEFSSFVFRSKSDRYILIGSDQTLSSEYRYLDANRPTDEFKVFLEREENHEYSLSHFGDEFFIRTNDGGAKNFKLMATQVGSNERSNWREVLPHRDDVYLQGIEIFSDYLVASERNGGLLQLRVRPWDGSDEHYLDFGEPAYLAFPTDNYEFDTPVLRFYYTSLTTPASTFDYNMSTRERTLLKEEEVLGSFDKADYVTERLHATATDGTQVPISIVYRSGFEKNGKAPLLLYAYGSYGASMDASFRSSRLSLLDRGFAFAIAHIRGGQELGRDWYENGKLLKKMNTFTDFVDCGRYLVAEGYTSTDRLFAEGGSAGGLLMGAVTNLAPELFHGIVSHVPFVDVVTTMLDDSIPLTTSEYDEWGNPHEKEYYDYMLSYSPYDNLVATDYPHLLITTGLHDSQVQYWEPAKYVAKLRTLKTDDNRLLLKTNMEAGHGGTSGRLKRHKETALTYAFLLDLVSGAG